MMTRMERRQISTAACATAIQQIADACGPPPAGSVAHWVQSVFAADEAPWTAQEAARRLGIPTTTLLSRCFRAGLPSPKRYVAWARLVRAVALLSHGRVAEVVAALQYSSAQHFFRHCRQMLGRSPREIQRDGWTVDDILTRFGREMVHPYRAALVTTHIEGPHRTAGARPLDRASDPHAEGARHQRRAMCRARGRGLPTPPPVSTTRPGIRAG